MECPKCCKMSYRIISKKKAEVACTNCGCLCVVTDYMGNLDLGGGYYSTKGEG